MQGKRTIKIHKRWLGLDEKVTGNMIQVLAFKNGRQFEHASKGLWHLTCRKSISRAEAGHAHRWQLCITAAPQETRLRSPDQSDPGSVGHGVEASHLCCRQWRLGATGVDAKIWQNWVPAAVPSFYCCVTLHSLWGPSETHWECGHDGGSSCIWMGPG